MVTIAAVRPRSHASYPCHVVGHSIVIYRLCHPPSIDYFTVKRGGNEGLSSDGDVVPGLGPLVHADSDIDKAHGKARLMVAHDIADDMVTRTARLEGEPLVGYRIRVSRCHRSGITLHLDQLPLAAIRFGDVEIGQCGQIQRHGFHGDDGGAALGVVVVLGQANNGRLVSRLRNGHKQLPHGILTRPGRVFEHIKNFVPDRLGGARRGVGHHVADGGCGALRTPTLNQQGSRVKAVACWPVSPEQRLQVEGLVGLSQGHGLGE